MLTPLTYASSTTATIACSLRRRGSRNDGKYERPDRFFGINSSISPTRVSHARGRVPLRCVNRRSGATSPSSAPISALISASINSWTTSATASLNEILKPTIAHPRDDIGNRHALTIGRRVAGGNLTPRLPQIRT